MYVNQTAQLFSVTLVKICIYSPSSQMCFYLCPCKPDISRFSHVYHMLDLITYHNDTQQQSEIRRK